MEALPTISKVVPKCGACGVTGVRIYRAYGMFRRPETDRCNACVADTSRGWMVPCILTDDGEAAWGYSSVPQEQCEAFYAMDEADKSKPSWNRIGGWGE